LPKLCCARRYRTWPSDIDLRAVADQREAEAAQGVGHRLASFLGLSSRETF
jgi:hypothetical protein